MYLTWDKKTITDFSNSTINSLYNEGYVFTRVGKGTMDQTRSLRIDLSKFEFSSENRRILKKTEGLQLKKHPLPYAKYDWAIGKMGKDFYETKFGPGIFTANKIKELMTDKETSNFNAVLVYTYQPSSPAPPPTGEGGRSPSPSGRGTKGEGSNAVGYCISLETNEIFHYCYPFYSLLPTPHSLSNIGLGMMLKAILYAKDADKKYLYLGSFSRPTDTYKLQFAGLEWWGGEGWKTDLEELKK